MRVHLCLCSYILYVYDQVKTLVKSGRSGLSPGPLSSAPVFSAARRQPHGPLTVDRVPHPRATRVWRVLFSVEGQRVFVLQRVTVLFQCHFSAGCIFFFFMARQYKIF